eukprot:TRINITY_DN22346_c0_g2_i2.p1 TRINITY_DN22346_c0_g2~~TRINITY_DN22346_c0_g2_i2.p1  ORF type:complete len:433 (+),score=87.84 TRINITY_DN22346_c0_g2_i2:62-1360(+)
MGEGAGPQPTLAFLDLDPRAVAGWGEEARRQHRRRVRAALQLEHSLPPPPQQLERFCHALPEMHALTARACQRVDERGRAHQRVLVVSRFCIALFGGAPDDVRNVLSYGAVRGVVARQLPAGQWELLLQCNPPERDVLLLLGAAPRLGSPGVAGRAEVAALAEAVRRARRALTAQEIPLHWPAGRGSLRGGARLSGPKCTPAELVARFHRARKARDAELLLPPLPPSPTGWRLVEAADAPGQLYWCNPETGESDWGPPGESRGLTPRESTAADCAARLAAREHAAEEEMLRPPQPLPAPCSPRPLLYIGPSATAPADDAGSVCAGDELDPIPPSPQGASAAPAPARRELCDVPSAVAPPRGTGSGGPRYATAGGLPWPPGWAPPLPPSAASPQRLAARAGAPQLPRYTERPDYWQRYVERMEAHGAQRLAGV